MGNDANELALYAAVGTTREEFETMASGAHNNGWLTQVAVGLQEVRLPARAREPRKIKTSEASEA
jgi:hypothetical protein